MTRTIGCILALLLISPTFAFWEFGTTTPEPYRTDLTPRQSFFRWQRIVRPWLTWGLPWDVLRERNQRKRLFCIAGISIDMLPLSTATILNRRVLLSSANYLDHYLPRQRELRIWALGRGGEHITPFRYRVWRVKRLFPRSDNPEQCFGIHCEFTPRHDIALILSMDPIYLYEEFYDRFMYATHAFMVRPKYKLKRNLYFVGSGYEYPLHIKENYKIFFTFLPRDDVVDCSIYLPKWWGKFICIINSKELTGIQNGGGLFTTYHDKENPSWDPWEVTITGVACFQIRYNQDRIYVFTDLRYYIQYVKMAGNLSAGEYYEYAYPEFSVYERGVYHIYSGDYGKRFIPRWDRRPVYFWHPGKWWHS